MAKEAKEKAKVSPIFLGYKKSNDTYQAYIDVGLILNGKISCNEIKNLEALLRKLPIISKLTIAWGLIIYYKNNNEIEKANELINFCKENAPYCKPLHDSDAKII